MKKKNPTQIFSKYIWFIVGKYRAWSSCHDDIVQFYWLPANSRIRKHVSFFFPTIPMVLLFVQRLLLGFIEPIELNGNLLRLSAE